MNKNKIIAIVVALIIILGIVITLTAGFNVDIMTRKHSQLQLYLGKEFNVGDIKSITDEIFKEQKVVIEKVDKFQESALISTEKITEEQKKDLVKKINEKYETKLEDKNIEIHSIPKIKLTDIVTPYFWTFILSTILVVIFMLIIIGVYKIRLKKKLGGLKAIVKAVLNIVILELLVVSFIAIARIPVGQNIVSILFVTYIVGIYVSTVQLFSKLNKLVLEEKEKEE